MIGTVLGLWCALAATALHGLAAPPQAATAAAAATSGTCEDRPDLVLNDFEAETYGDWQVSGNAFGPGPAQGTLPNQMPVEGFLGQRLVNSYFQGDTSVGELRSPEFAIERTHLQFLIGGGKNAEKTCIQLIVQGSVVRTATGPNDQPGGIERLEWQSWDVRELQGQRAVLVIVDQATGGWGHINVDQIMQTDRPNPGPRLNANREIVAEKRYLHFPVRTGAARKKVRVAATGLPLREFEIELADQDPQWWAFMDLSDFAGKPLAISVDRLPADSGALEAIFQSDEIVGQQSLYQEPLRPQVHFSSRRGWNNDPNGLVYVDGVYHLFYQHNPYGWGWGNMHWGHATSSDLLHWQEGPIALYPDELGPMFSGSAVVDAQNTSGWQVGNVPPVVLFYTAAGDPAVQCAAYSTDGAKTWTKYDGNPILKNITPGNRDPKVFWHPPSNKWVMCLYVGLPKPELPGGTEHVIQFFGSPNLRDWSYLSQTSGFYECPDIFELPVDGNAQNVKWVLTAASSEYMLGTFDGEQFTPETTKLPGHRGNGFYAAQTFSNLPAAQARVVQIGWGQMPAPEMPFNQMMCFPCELTLRSTADGPRLCFMPIREIAQLRQDTFAFDEFRYAPGTHNTANNWALPLEVRAEFTPGDASLVTLRIYGVDVQYDKATQEIVCLDRRAPITLAKGKVQLQIIADRTSLEIFGGQGTLYMPMAVIPKPNAKSLQTVIEGGEQVIALKLSSLKSIWRRP